MSETSTIERLLPWALRAIWVVVAITGSSAIDAATAERSDAAGTAVTIGAAIGWVAAVAAMAVPSVIGLTASRLLVPLAAPVAMAAWIAGGGADAAIFLVVAVLAAVVVLSGEFGRAFVQASAYGEEDRFLLRPPPAYALAAALTWVIWGAAAIVTPMLLGARSWILGLAALVVTIALGVWSWPRWHRLARRWLVIVPVGLVVHDQLVLGETLMLRRQEIGTIRLAPAGTQAADMTGPTGGHALEILTTESVTAILAGTPRSPGGSAIHLTAGLVAPTRPGRALAGAAARRLPVGDR